jgi:hypothetical protein
MSATNGQAHDNGYAADERIDDLYSFWPGTTPAPQPLPEARASCNVRLVVDGREVQWTLRDHDEGRLAARLERLLAQYPAPQPAPQAASPGEGWCSKHGVQMKRHSNANGQWYSHFMDDKHCKGR